MALASAHTRQYLFTRAIIARAKLYMTNQLHANTSACVLSYLFANNSFAISC